MTYIEKTIEEFDEKTHFFAEANLPKSLRITARNFLRTALENQKKKILGKVKEIKFCDGGENCKCSTEREKDINDGKGYVVAEIIKVINEN